MPRITIAIPFFNEERALAGAIRSVFAQTFEDWELLLLDDGSTDASLAIAQSVQDTRVRVFSDHSRKRLPTRLNEIVAHARCDLIARMDGDDVIHPTRLARELEILDADPKIDAVGTYVAYRLENVPPVIAEMKLPTKGRDVLTRGALAHATMLARRTFLQRFPYDTRYDRAEDRDLFCRSFGDARLQVVPAPLYVIQPSVDAHGFLSSYRSTMRQNRALYLRHGPRLAGARATTRAVFGSFAREATYLAAAQFGMLPRLVGRRGRTATMEEARLVAEAVDASVSTRVPGF